VNATDLAALIEDPARAVGLPQPEAVRLLLELAPVQEALRVAAARSPSANGQRPEPEEWLDAAGVADRLGISLKAVYARSGLPWSPALGRTRRMAASDLDDYVRGKRR